MDLPTPNQTTSQSPPKFTYFLVAVAIVSILVLVGYGIFYFTARPGGPTGEKIVEQPQPPPSQGLSATADYPGFQKALELREKYAPFIERFDGRIKLSGTLVSFEPEKSWTIEKDGKTTTITNTGSRVQYSKESGIVDSSSLAVGKTVAITFLIDIATGEQRIAIEVESE